jgi:CheY-like chemotaxis protein
MTGSLRGPVLVVDDDDAIRRLVSMILSRDKLEVTTARDGGEALDHLARRAYSLILLDLMMPRFNGYDVLAHLKANSPTTLGHVILMTASSDADLARVDSSQLAGIIRKPFDIEELRTYVNNAYERPSNGHA